jgi:hypothetical protein
MKKIPGAVKVSGVIILSILLVQACARIKPFVSDKPVVIELWNAEVKEPDNFCSDIKDHVSGDAQYGFVVVRPGKEPMLCCNPGDCSASTLTVKVDNVTKSATLEHSVNPRPLWGSHVTQRLSSFKSADITVVTAELKSQP